MQTADDRNAGEAPDGGRQTLPGPDGNADSVSVGDLVSGVWRARRYVLAGAIIAGLLGVVVAFAMEPIFRAQVVAVPAHHEEGGLSQALGEVSGLASIAGVDLQGGQHGAEYLEFLKSKGLTERFITENDLLSVLYPEKWDPSRRQWKAGLAAAEVPTMYAAVSKFNKGVRSVSDDRRTSVVTVSINWKDRKQAAAWANAYLDLANRELGRRAIAEAQSTLGYLNNELPHATTIEVQQALSRLMEEQMKIIALANSHRDYAFTVIDPATVPDPKDRVSPNRTLIVLGLGLFGSIVGLGVGRLRTRRAFGAARGRA